MKNRFDSLNQIFKKNELLKFLKWLISNIVLAILAAFLVPIFMNINAESKLIKEDDKKIQQLYLGESSEFIDYLFGVPIYNFEENGLNNSYYFLDDVVIRVVLDGDELVGYIITITDDDRNVYTKDLYYYQPNQKLGLLEYSSINTEKSLTSIDAFLSASTNSEVFYIEEYQDKYNDYFYANLSYGFFSEKDLNLLREANYFLLNNDNIQINNISQYRLASKPNSFGLFVKGYREKISLYPADDKAKLVNVIDIFKLTDINN